MNRNPLRVTLDAELLEAIAQRHEMTRDLTGTYATLARMSGLPLSPERDRLLEMVEDMRRDIAERNHRIVDSLVTLVKVHSS